MSVSSVRPGTKGHAHSHLLRNLLEMSLAMMVGNGREKGGSVESLTGSLNDRVERLLHPSKRPLEWGHPLVSTTPTSVAIQELTLRIEAVEKALREIALEVEKLSDEE